MAIARRSRDAAVEAVLAGALVGTGEALHVVHAAGDGSLPIIAAVATAGAVAIAAGVRLVLAAFAHLPIIAAWGRAIAERRALAVWRCALVATSLIAFGAGVFAIASLTHERFRFVDAGPVGLLVAALVAPLAGLVLVGAAMIDRRIGPRLAARTVGSAPLVVAGVLALVLLALAPIAVVAFAAPALTLAPVITLGVLGTVVIAARAIHIGRRLAAQIAAVVVMLAVAAGTYALSSSSSSRGAIVVQGTISAGVARTIWSLADRDGDQYAGSAAGGADCDDGDPLRNPAAQDIPGNGIDENCTGADAGGTGARTAPRPADAQPQRPNIVVISIDALRADHLGSYGYPRKTSPVIDALAATAVRFDWAVTSCPSTRCAIPSLLTGRFASTLRARAERPDIPTLATTLRAAGWNTAAITCCSRFSLTTNELAGFADVDASADGIRLQRPGQSNSDVVIDNALAWLHDTDPHKPYLLWIHLYEPHFPYAAPSGPAFGDGDIDRYDGEILFADTQLGRLLAALDPSTIVALTSDHGDEFGEHGIRFHARSLYNQVVHIPLIIRAPGATPHVVKTPVSLVDVMPTLLELAGVAGPAGMNGVSLAPAVRGGAVPERPLLIELAPGSGITRDMAAVVSAGWKVIWDREANAWSLYKVDDREDRDDRTDDPALPVLQQLLFETLDRETSRLP